MCDEVFITGDNYPNSDVCCKGCGNGADNLVLATPEFADYYWGKY
jgi:hypothetical protein